MICALTIGNTQDGGLDLNAAEWCTLQVMQWTMQLEHNQSASGQHASHSLC